jgi:predicted enzyme related to lactoylglutathione lyase
MATPHVTGAFGLLRASVPNVAVDDVVAALAEVERLGGSTVEGRTQVGDMGWSGYFRDTEGNLMGPWEAAPHS